MEHDPAGRDKRISEMQDSAGVRQARTR
jgi:hypothetical protein